MPMSFTLLAGVILGTLTVGLAPSLSHRSPVAPPGAPVVEVVATDYAFHAPDSVAAGWVTFRLRVRGAESHHLIIFRLDQQVSLSDFHRSLTTGATGVPGITPLGGAEGPAEGEGPVESTLRLSPGRHVLACLIASEDGRRHVAKGMFRPLTVVSAPAGASIGNEPGAAARILLSPRGPEPAGPLRAGSQVLRVETVAPGEHHMLIFRLGRPGTEPEYVGGTTRQVRGAVVYLLVRLAAGEYELSCRVMGPDGRPHAEHGEVQRVRVLAARRRAA
jgi:hypothetical protein